MSDQAAEMSETEKEESQQDRDEDPSPTQAESDGQDNDQRKSEDADSRPRRTGSGILTVLALIVAFGALGFAAWVWLQFDTDREDDRIEDVQAALSTERERAGQIEDSLDSLRASMDEIDQALRDQDRRLDDLGGALESMGDSMGDEVSRVEQRLEEVEDEVLEQVHQLWQREETQREVDRELDRHLAMIETAALLRLGQERAELAQDFAGARSAYRRAAAVLAGADDPRLSQVRRLVVAELDALEGVEAPDWIEAQARLERLARQVAEWPLERPAPGVEVSEEETEVPEQGWTDSMRSALRELVRVRPRDETPITQEQLDTIRESLRLRLTAAELALARRDLSELDRHLNLVADTLDSHFDQQASAVQEAMQVIEQLRELEPASAPSGLGEALARLREDMEST